MRLAWLNVCLMALGCTSVDRAAQGGAIFRDVAIETPDLPASALYSVCWPEEASSLERVLLTFLPGDVLFEARDGASNSTGRCLREIASTYPFSSRPDGVISVAPPRQPIDGWAVLAWVKLLSPSRFGVERGLLDPEPYARACLDRGEVRQHTRFVVRHVPGPEIRVVPAAVSEAERCLEAVLASTAWPSGRTLSFELTKTAANPSSRADVAMYFSPPSSLGKALEPQAVREAMLSAKSRVAECWDSALVRRPGLGGARTFRFRVDDSGAVSHAWVVQGAEGVVSADFILDRCLEAAIRSLHFPPVAGDGVYTWVFAARE